MVDPIQSTSPAPDPANNQEVGQPGSVKPKATGATTLRTLEDLKNMEGGEKVYNLIQQALAYAMLRQAQRSNARLVKALQEARKKG